MQMPGQMYKHQLDAFATIWKTEGHETAVRQQQLTQCALVGMRGFYRGWSANTLKVVPQNSIRFVSYELMKKLLGVKKAKTDT